MGANNYFSHTDSLGRDPFQRMAAFGYNYNTWKGENLAAGADTAQGAFNLWKNSPGHNANMLNANFKVIGIARVYSAGIDLRLVLDERFRWPGLRPAAAGTHHAAAPTAARRRARADRAAAARAAEPTPEPTRADAGADARAHAGAHPRRAQPATTSSHSSAVSGSG